MDTFLAMDVQRAAIQTMESLYILATSKNIETIKGRYDFLLTLIPILTSAKNNTKYSAFIDSALDQFKTTYPASVPQEYQLSVLSNPEAFDLNEFYCTSLVTAIKRFYGKQFEEITALKKEAAKRNRIERVIKTIRSVQDELQLKCSSAASYSAAVAELEKLTATSNTIS